MVGVAGRTHGRTTTLAASVARQIEQEIIDRGWPAWEALGTEANLLERYGVSRSVFREAVRILEHRQLVVTKRGPGGGLFVGAPASEVVVEAIAVSFEFAAVSATELFEARKVLESIAVRLACARASNRELAALAVHPNSFDGGMHARIARLSGNAAVPLFLDALLALTSEQVLERLDERLEGLPSGHDDAHRELLGAVVNRDTDKAVLLLQEHLDTMARWVSDQPARRGAGAPSLPERDMGSQKLPERIARQVRHDVLKNRWTEGHLIGSESDLLARFGVSRNVLREAVRILEHHGIATMRRGIGGGLLVRTPDPTMAIEAAATYLEYLHLQEAHLHELRDGIEQATTALAARRITDVGADRLREHLEIELAGADFNFVAVGLHILLAELCGNRALHFFTSVLMELQAEHSPPPEQARPTEPDAAGQEISRAHRSIVDAVVAGDEALAVRRMARHIGAVAPYVDVTYRRR